MPDESTTKAPRSRFRVSLAWMMSAVFVLACMFATWHGTRSWMQPTFAMLYWTGGDARFTKDLAPEFLDAAKERAISRVAFTEVAVGVRISTDPGSSFIQIACGTGDPPRDLERVNAVVAAFLKSEPPGTFGPTSTLTMGDTWDHGASFTERLIYSLLFGMMAASGVDGIRRSLKARNARRSQLRKPTPIVAGAANDNQR